MSHPLVVNIKTDGCDVYVGRPSKWGNQYIIGEHGNRDQVLMMYAMWLGRHPEWRAMARRELRGKVLGCHCAPKDCHADLLAEVANL